MNPWQLLLDLLGGVLNFFYQIIPNLGVAIILRGAKVRAGHS